MYSLKKKTNEMYNLIAFTTPYETNIRTML